VPPPDSPRGAERGFIYRDGALTQIEAPGAVVGPALDINDAGAIIGGASFASTGLAQPFLFSGGVLTRALLATSVVICLVGAWLPLSPLSGALGFVGLPRMYWLILPFLLIVYLALAQALKGSSHAPSEHYSPFRTIER
jgi:hypothetical protein